MLGGLEPDTSIQANLFAAPAKNAVRLLMNTLDNLNFGLRDDMVKFASAGTKKRLEDETGAAKRTIHIEMGRTETDTIDGKSGIFKKT